MSESGSLDLFGPRTMSESGSLDLFGPRIMSESGSLDLFGPRTMSESGSLWKKTNDQILSSQEELEKLTRRHAVKVLPQAGCSVEEVGSAVGEVVGFESIKSASRMNSAVVIFLDEVVKVERVLEAGIVLRYPLVNPSKKITVSNAPPFRRQVYMILKDADSHLNLTLNFKVDGFNYNVFVTSETMKCFGCGAEGHLIRTCPEARRENAWLPGLGAAGGGCRLLGLGSCERTCINASKRKKSADKGQGGGKTRKTLQSLSDEEEEAELTVSQEERITSYSVEKIRRFLAETKETHSDSSNERDWRREWPGQVFLSHKQSNSAGVGILFSRAFSPQSVELHHVLPGHALMVKALYEKGEEVQVHISTEVVGLWKNHHKAKSKIANLLGITAQGALVRFTFYERLHVGLPFQVLFQPAEQERPEEGHPLPALGQWVFTH
ncbi:hypothetical protein L3Q82_026128 [Scortum barcoo]|uniref:Uncharacterized protein n=1 Tax=Scortum barcoo TaxID=214431 RepID=A0ACB8WMX7_9TELE|nr:hypothetical protein L3Q82_026128 [Scortum barcoo]